MIAMLTKPTKDGYILGKSFVGLLERFPLLAICSEDEYDRATAVVEDLMGRDDLDADEDRYLDSLVTLVAAYEGKAYDFDAGQITPLAALKTLLDANKMSAADLGRLIGSSSNASMILNGDRQISRNVAKRLADRFKVDAGLFL
jgi:HTH-type transcriptional regulator/antitoxin HigA